jgi:SPP1 family predicted phage head-tail adaptor
MTVFTSLLNNTFTVSRRVRVSDGQGGHIITYLEIGTVEGRIRPASSNERIVADAEEQQISHMLYVSHGSDVARGDLVECSGLQVEVLGVREPSLAGQHLEIDCLERQAEVSTEVGT